MQRPVTESQNPLTLSIDAADPVGMVRLLRQSDAQMFAGWDVFGGVLDEEILEAFARVAWRLSRLLTDPDNLVLLSGAGTSGRFAHLLCMEFNRVQRENRLPEIFKPLIAGGEFALIQAQEAAEDSVAAAIRDLNEAIPADLKRGMYIGITAGISAPYVAAQLEVIGGNEKFDSSLLGFNPASLARATLVDGWDKSVKDVLDRALESDRFTLLNPVYGPEPITGSTRMKGGSMTKIALEVVYAVALDIARAEALGDGAKWSVSEDDLLPLRALIVGYLRRFQDATTAAYSNVPALAEIVRLAGMALRSGGRIIYLGRGIAGYLAMIDASECPPTYGADPFDVRGYMLEGWEYLGYNTAAMRARGRQYEISHEFFEREVLPDLSKGDLVIGVANGVLGENTRRLLTEAIAARATTALVLVTTDASKGQNLPEGLRQRCIVEVPEAACIAGTNNLLELSLKLCLNAITTGAHVMAGKVYNNIMIDLKISNSKLHDRAVRLISQLTGVPREKAHAALHEAIFRVKGSAAELEHTTITTYIQRAISRQKVVPLAILLATGKWSLEKAEARLSEEPRVRRLIEEAIAKTATVS